MYVQQPELKFKDQTIKCYIWSAVYCGAENRPIRKIDRNNVEGFEMLCWRRMETISWTDRVRNGEVLRGEEEELNILHTRKQSKTHWTGHILSRK